MVCYDDVYEHNDWGSFTEEIEKMAKAELDATIEIAKRNDIGEVHRMLARRRALEIGKILKINEKIRYKLENTGAILSDSEWEES